ncbi:hypothetical protein [Acinetobacter sp.]|uniref:hypothetical protein n=1 Tax=Acinetobacter sp. TaxID=472 RepID=UPI002FD9A63C
MRYHAIVHNLRSQNETIFECHVIADNTGSARKEVVTYLNQNNYIVNFSDIAISLLEYREDIETTLLLIRASEDN